MIGETDHSDQCLQNNLYKNNRNESLSHTILQKCIISFQLNAL
jgi:hypothetical protein